MGKSSKQRRRKAEKHLYAITFGSNRALSRALPPKAIIAAALDALNAKPLKVKRVSPLITSRPLGPSARDFVNGAALLRSCLKPPEMLARLQAVEHRFGRRRRQRWGARTLDLDIALWTGGIWRAPRLKIPHPPYAQRDFALAPLCAIAPHWRDPVHGLTLRQLHMRLKKPKPVDPTLSSR